MACYFLCVTATPLCMACSYLPACLQNSAAYQAATGSMAWVNFQWSLGIPQHYQGPNGTAMSGAC